MTTPDPYYRPNSSSLYGQTEVTGLATTAAVDAAGLHGRPSPMTQIRVFNGPGEEVGMGGVGEIAIRGPQVMVGYFRRPDLNARRQHDGWHWTNDLGRREADGTITFLGSKGRLIKSGIENIYPSEIEACIRRIRGLRDAGVIGVPDVESGGQTVKAIVVAADGANVTAEAVIRHCAEHLAPFKVPRSVVLVDGMPRKAGVIDYEELDRSHGGGGYPGSALFTKMTGL